MIRQIIQSIKLQLHRKEKFYGLFISQLGFVPKNKGLYQLALLHRSASRVSASGVVQNYERLEFLGDAVLGAVVAELLYKFFPNKDEGFLTRVRSKVVSRESLNDLAVQLGLDKAVIARSDISRNKHVYGDVFEAFIGAIFLDQGFAITKRFIEKFIFPNFFDIKNLVTVDTNYKSRLIEWGQKHKIEVQLKTEEHRSRHNKFSCTILIENKERSRKFGTSKKEAEQKAAQVVIEMLSKQSGEDARD